MRYVLHFAGHDQLSITTRIPNCMASNEIPDSPEPLISLATDAADGAAAEGAGIGLMHNTAAAIRLDLARLVGDPAAVPPVIGARNSYHLAKAAKTAGTAAQRSEQSTCRAFCASAVGLLKNYLGNQWNSQWQAAGFSGGSLAMPDDPMPMLGELSAYFAAHPAHENPQLGITAAACQVRKAALSAARAAANAKIQELGSAKAANDAAVKALYQRMTGLRSELAQLLSDDDPRWYAFGFDRPSDGWGPGPVEHLVLTPAGPGMVFADWEDARRAERYRIFKQVAGVDAEPVELTSTAADSQFNLIGLPSGATVTVKVVAVNQAGDGAMHATATVVVA